MACFERRLRNSNMWSGNLRSNGWACQPPNATSRFKNNRTMILGGYPWVWRVPSCCAVPRTEAHCHCYACRECYRVHHNNFEAVTFPVHVKLMLRLVAQAKCVLNLHFWQTMLRGGGARGRTWRGSRGTTVGEASVGEGILSGRGERRKDWVGGRWSGVGVSVVGGEMVGDQHGDTFNPQPLSGDVLALGGPV